MQRIMQVAEKLVADLREANREDETAFHLRNKEFVPHCLLVEDDPGDADLSKIALKAVGAEVQVATSGDEAIQLLDDSATPGIPDYHIVFLDLVLRQSVAQGIHVLQYIRKKFPKLHVVLVSGHIDESILNFISRQGGGYIGIITKPLHRVNVREIMEKHRMVAYA